MLLPSFQLTYLEDPNVGQTPVQFMITENAADSLKMYCRGSDKWLELEMFYILVTIMYLLLNKCELMEKFFRINNNAIIFHIYSPVPLRLNKSHFMQ